VVGEQNKNMAETFLVTSQGENLIAVNILQQERACTGRS